MRNGWGVIGIGIFLLVTLRQVLTYGKEWRLGRYGMPVSVLAADGRHYADGTEVDAVTLALVRSGWQEEVELLPTGVLLACLAHLVRLRVRRRRTEKRCRRLKRRSGAAGSRRSRTRRKSSGAPGGGRRPRRRVAASSNCGPRIRPTRRYPGPLRKFRLTGRTSVRPSTGAPLGAG